MAKDYARRTYVSNGEYGDQMKMHSIEEMDRIRHEPHSEFQKPYPTHGDPADIPNDTYFEMEYFQPYPPGYPGWSYPQSPDIPFTSLTVEDTPYVPDLWFHCMGDPCYCPGEVVTKSFVCSADVVGYRIISGNEEGFFTINAADGSHITISADAEADGGFSFEIALRRLIYRNSSGALLDVPIAVYETLEYSVGRCPIDECCGDISEEDILRFEEEDNSDTIGRNSSITVMAIGGITGEVDYHWTISGTGFWLDEACTITEEHTGFKTHLIYTDDTACGTGTVSVEDRCGKAEWVVRCTVGYWNEIIPASCETSGGNYKVSYYQITGKYRNYQLYAGCGGAGAGFWVFQENCMEHYNDNSQYHCTAISGNCATHWACDNDHGCTECIPNSGPNSPPYTGSWNCWSDICQGPVNYSWSTMAKCTQILRLWEWICF